MLIALEFEVRSSPGQVLKAVMQLILDVFIPVYFYSVLWSQQLGLQSCVAETGGDDGSPSLETLL